MKQSTQHETETKNRPDAPTPLTHEQDTFPTLCGPGCSCGPPAKNGKWKVVIMLIVIAVFVISVIYKEIM